MTSTSSSPPNVILLSLDCARREALSCYPETFPVSRRFPNHADTPNIDSIAADGVLFRQAFCQAPFTPASHASVFTGLYPLRHGLRGMFGHKLRDDVPTLAERCREAGLETGAFVGAHALSSDYGLDRGFDVYDETFEDARENWVIGHRRPGREVADQALEWLDSITDGDRFFGFLHFFDAHDAMSSYSDTPEDSNSDGEYGTLRRTYRQYLRPLDARLGKPIAKGWQFSKQFVDNVAQCRKRLRGEIPYGERYHLKQISTVDDQIGRLVDALKDRGEYNKTMLIVMADHGDAFGAHGEFSHREYLYDTTVHVPLLVKPPGGSDVEDCSNIVRLVDIYSTVLSTLGISYDSVDGENLFDAIGSDDDRLAYAETRHEATPERPTDLEKSFAALRSSRWKFIVDCLSDERELYDVTVDPDEQTNVYDSYSDEVAALEQEMQALFSEAPSDTNPMSNEELDGIQNRLEGLGYL